MTAIEDQSMLDILEEVSTGNNIGVYYDANNIIAYEFLPEYNLVLTMKDSLDEILASSNMIAKKNIILTILTLIIVVLAVFATSHLITKPLRKVQNAVNDLGELTLIENNDIQRFIGNRNEVGTIATSVDSLTSTLRDVVSTLKDCSDSLIDGSVVMKKTVTSLVTCAAENSRTTEELTESINDTSRTIQKVNTDIAAIHNIMEDSRQSNAERILIADNMIKNAGTLSSSINDKAAKSFSDMNDISGQLKDSMDATNNEIDRVSKLVDNIQKESRHFDVIISNNEKSVNSITEKAEITYSMVNKLDSLTKANSNTAKELNKIVDQFR